VGSSDGGPGCIVMLFAFPVGLPLQLSCWICRVKVPRLLAATGLAFLSMVGSVFLAIFFVVVIFKVLGKEVMENIDLRTVGYGAYAVLQIPISGRVYSKYLKGVGFLRGVLIGVLINAFIALPLLFLFLFHFLHYPPPRRL
jgi:hypothetical protein